MLKKIPVYEPMLAGAAREYVLACLDSNWISSRGEFIDKFESNFANWSSVGYAASVSNGTVALHLALLALDIGPGDEVIVPTFTYIASVNAIAYVGATPVFVDSLPNTWQMDPKDIEAKISANTKAIMAVHLYGQPADMQAIIQVATRYGLRVVEDAAEAFGSRIGDRHVGSFGDIGTYSFFGNKTITTGEGGMVVTNDPHLDARVRKLKGQGLAGTREYWHDEIGYNYRMTNICAAIGLAQLEMADELLARKRRIAECYREALDGLPVDFFWEQPGTTSSFWMNCISVEDSAERDGLRKHLATSGIETRPAFYPAHTMPMYLGFASGRYPVAEALAAKGINLPSSPLLRDEDVAFVAERVSAYFK